MRAPFNWGIKGNYALYVASSADATGSVVSQSTRYRNFANSGVYSYKNLDFGKHNCFIRDDAKYTFDGSQDKYYYRFMLFRLDNIEREHYKYKY